MTARVGTWRGLDPDQDLSGRLVVVAPHMDDELIGCGALLASLSDGARASVVYLTDGSRSPESPTPWHSVDRQALAQARRREARAGLDAVGVPSTNAHFLDLPDGGLGGQRDRLRHTLAEVLADLAPRRVLIPFRMDRHPDHLAAHGAVIHLVETGRLESEIHEYFVYSQWKLLPGGDIRSWVQSDLLRSLVPTKEVRLAKRRALELHRSQSSRHFEWQRRPNLTPAFLDRVSSEPETFLETSRAPKGAAVFPRGRFRIRMTHRLEPVLKRAKDRALALVGG